jgi:hypothetical protein
MIRPFGGTTGKPVGALSVLSCGAGDSAARAVTATIFIMNDSELVNFIDVTPFYFVFYTQPNLYNNVKPFMNDCHFDGYISRFFTC